MLKIINNYNILNSKEYKINKFEIKKNKIFNLIINIKNLFLLIILFFLFVLHCLSKNKLSYENMIVNEPIIPTNPGINDILKIKNNSKYSFNYSHIRYHFQNLYKNRKIFKINYSFFPYTKINKSISYEENAKNIYDSTGILNISKLDYYYNDIDINTLNLNHIHLSMAFDNNYIELASISIASILNTSNLDTFIHFHILCLNFNFNDMEKLIKLKSINSNVDFIFYNAKQAEYDFGYRGIKELRGIGNYAKILSPQIVNNTNKIIIMDSGDIIAQKDISEIFFFDLEDNYFGWILESVAGINSKTDMFWSNNFYPNAGICLINVKLFRSDDLYQKAFFFALSYNDLACPFQNILISISIYKFKYLPLKYNCRLFFDNDAQIFNKTSPTNLMNEWMNEQKFSPYKYSIEEIKEAAFDPIINHFYNFKIQNYNICNIFTVQWIKYSKMTGLYEQIKKKYPKPFECENITKKN